MVTEAANGGFDNVMASVSYTMPANVEVLYLNGTGLTGTGTAASETLVTLGANTLVGGGGDDAFVFLGNANGAAVADFNSAGDHDLIFSGFGTAAQGATFTRSATTVADPLGSMATRRSSSSATAHGSIPGTSCSCDAGRRHLEAAQLHIVVDL